MTLNLQRPSAEPPTALGPDATPWRCRCGNLLGLRDRHWLYSRHRGRGVVAPLPARVRCEVCGHQQVCLPADGAVDEQTPR